MLDGSLVIASPALRFADGERTMYIDPWGTGEADPRRT